MPETELELVVQRYRRYGLKPFLPILQAVKEHWGEVSAVQDKDVLELGPGTRVGMMRWLKAEMGVARIQAAGVAMIWPWTRQRHFIQAHVTQERFLDYVNNLPKRHFDFVYSRLVFEQHSIDPFKLLGSRAYWQQFKKKDFQDFDETYPASIPNLQAVFKRLWRSVRPGGLVVSFIGKRKYSALNRTFLESLRPAKIQHRDVGRLSQIVTVVR